jgi:hypothetical protein
VTTASKKTSLTLTPAGLPCDIAPSVLPDLATCGSDSFNLGQRNCLQTCGISFPPALFMDTQTALPILSALTFEARCGVRLSNSWRIGD